MSLLEHTPTMDPEQTLRLTHIPPLYRPLFQRCYEGTATRPQRYKAKCLDCCSYQRIEVASCSHTSCPLHTIRPYQTDSPDPEDEPREPTALTNTPLASEG